MTTYTIDTNAGPILQRDFTGPAAARSFMERSIPLLKRRGYTCRWERSKSWHVVRVLNSRGTIVHSAGFRPGALTPTG